METASKGRHRASRRQARWQRRHLPGPVLAVLGALAIAVSWNVAAVGGAQAPHASSAQAEAAHAESGSPGPNAVTAFGTAATVPGATLARGTSWTLTLPDGSAGAKNDAASNWRSSSDSTG